MARPKKTAGAGDPVRERLLQAALNLFTSRGYAATTVREIVEAAGVSKPVLYYYFNSKEGIYLELIAEPFRRHEELIAGAAKGSGSPTGQIFTLCETLFSHFVANLKVARLLFSIYYGPPQGTPPVDFESHGRELLRVIHGLVQQAVAAGEMCCDCPEDVSWGINGILNSAYQEQLSPQPQIDGAGLQRVLRLFLSGIGGSK